MGNDVTQPKIWHVSDGGKEDGPFSEAEVKSLIKQGAFSPDAMVWKEGRAEWRPMFPKRTTPPPAPPVTATAPIAIPYATPAPARRPGRGEIICPNPNCGYVGRPIREARGSAVLGCLLCFLLLLPGVIYLIFMGGYRYSCPQCGMQVRNEN
jgi:hypothetical protein